MDITAEEKLLMQDHGRYTREHFLAGKILIYGPVMASDDSVWASSKPPMSPKCQPFAVIRQRRFRRRISQGRVVKRHRPLDRGHVNDNP